MENPLVVTELLVMNLCNACTIEFVYQVSIVALFCQLAAAYTLGNICYLVKEIHAGICF